MIGFDHIMHQWTLRWIEEVNQPNKTAFYSYYEEPCSGSPIWCCLWCQWRIHVDCHGNMFNETDDVCDLGPFRRLILSPLHVKELNSS